MARSIKPDDLLQIQLAGDPQLSPDGKRLAYVVARIDADTNEYRHQIYAMEAAPGARPVPFTAGTKSDRNPRWSPDGTRLAFLSNRSGKNQLWVMEAFGGEARQVTFFKEGIDGGAVWSPDSRSLAFVATVGKEGPGKEGDKDDESDPFKKYTKGVRRITRIWYKLDGSGFLDPDKHSQIFTIAVDGEEKPEPRQVTSGPWNHIRPAWSPDGRRLAFVANRRDDDDYVPFYSDIWVLNLDEPGAEPLRITPDGYNLTAPAWSPDGATIACIGHPWEPYRGYSANQLYLAAADGSGMRRLAEGWDRSFWAAVITDMPGPASDGIVWTPDGNAVMLLGSDSGQQHLYAVDTESGYVTQLTKGEHCVTSWATDHQCQKIAVSLTRPDLPADLFLVEGPDLLRLTETNGALLADLELAPVEAFRFKTGTGDNPYLQAHDCCEQVAEADGWVMKPAGFAEGKRYPTVLEVHGGPMAMYGWTFFLEFQCLAAAGYAVVYTNPRGSQGYGQHFCACIEADWGNLDYADVMAGLDSALAQYPWLDVDQLFIAGGSYGGFMTNWAVGHTNRFKAAITMRSVVNEASSVGTSDFGFVDLQSYPSRPWNDMTFYRQVSPITFVENIHTPLLIEHQEQDHRCPMEQAEQLYTALKSLKRTVEFVRYPDSSHGMSRTGKPWLRVHRLRTILEWFARYTVQP